MCFTACIVTFLLWILLLLASDTAGLLSLSLVVRRLFFLCFSVPFLGSSLGELSSLLPVWTFYSHMSACVSFRLSSPTFLSTVNQIFPVWLSTHKTNGATMCLRFPARLCVRTRVCVRVCILQKALIVFSHILSRKCVCMCVCSLAVGDLHFTFLLSLLAWPPSSMWVVPCCSWHPPPPVSLMARSLEQPAVSMVVQGFLFFFIFPLR